MGNYTAEYTIDDIKGWTISGLTKGVIVFGSRIIIIVFLISHYYKKFSKG